MGKTTLAELAIQRVGLPTTVLNLEKQTLMRSRIDEAHESRRLDRYVGYMKVSWPATRIILSGSTSARLFRYDVRYPVGRVQRFVVRPFSFTEFLVASGKELLSRDLLGGATEVSPGRHGRLLEYLDQPRGFTECGGATSSRGHCGKPDRDRAGGPLR